MVITNMTVMNLTPDVAQGLDAFWISEVSRLNAENARLAQQVSEVVSACNQWAMKAASLERATAPVRELEEKNHKLRELLRDIRSERDSHAQILEIDNRRLTEQILDAENELIAARKRIAALEAVR